MAMYLDEILADEELVKQIITSSLPREQMQEMELKVLGEAFRYYFDNSEVFRAVTKDWGTTPDNWDGKTIADIPTMHTGLFKKQQQIKKRLFCVPDSELPEKYRHVSSGTSGAGFSMVARDQLTLDRSAIMEGAMMKYIQQIPEGAFAPLALPATDQAYMALAMYNCYKRMGCETDTYIDISPTREGKPPIFRGEDLARDIGMALAKGQPVILNSTPSNAQRIAEELKARDLEWNLWGLVLGGGWRKKAREVRPGEPIMTDPNYLISMAEEYFGTKKVGDFFGMTEIDEVMHCCPKYKDIRHLHTLPFMPAIITDPDTKLEIREVGKPGELHLYSTLNHAFPAFVQTGDKAVYRNQGPCPDCGSYSPTIEVIGRMKEVGTDAEMSGCNAILDAQLKATDINF